MGPDGQRLFLGACRRWNSEGWVTRDGRQIVKSPPSGSGGIHCERGQYTGSPSWAATRAALGDRGPYLFLQSNVIWHIARGGDTVQTDEARSVYLTVCGFWIEQSQIGSVPPGTSGTDVCSKCANYVDQEELASL